MDHLCRVAQCMSLADKQANLAGLQTANETCSSNKFMFQ